MAQVVDALLNVSATPPAPPVKNYSQVLTRNKQKTDAQGNPLFNPDGTPIWIPDLDSTGKQKTDAQGNLLWITEQYGNDNYDVKNTSDTNYSKWTGLKMGDSWVNYRYNPKDSNNPDNRRRDSLKAWMAKQILEQDRTIREKMTLFLHNHFATETNDVNDAIMSYNHHALLRKYALGNFKKLVLDVTLDPHMLVYLNGDTNDGSKATSVNENYGRELQELFTVGKGPKSGYTEDDVKAAARVLSGWLTTRRNDALGKTILDPATPLTSFFAVKRHDITDKQFSAFYGNKLIKGKSTVTAGTEEITEMIDMIFSVDEVSKFIARKLFVFFVYSKIDADIETNVIEPLAELLRTSKFELKPVLKALLTSDYFYKNEYIGAMIKSPVDFAFGQLRMMQFTLPSDPKAYEAQYSTAQSVVVQAALLGQSIGDPPNVAGWAAYYQEPLFYEVWLDSSSVQGRINIQNRGNFNTGTAFINAESKSLMLPLGYFKIVSETSAPNDINVVITDLAALMYPAAISQATKDRVKVKFFTSSEINLKTEAQWTTAVNALFADPNTVNVNAAAFRKNINKLFNLMFFAAEYQLH
jgi:uncharacterized protein (DUF1800 family)